MIGQTVSHYRIIEKLGAGGMGEVFLAEDTKLDRKVALKFLPESLQKDSEARRRLLREAQAASKLDHPNIVTIHSVEESDGRDFIVMAYVDGQDLIHYVNASDRPLDEKLELACHVAEGLNHAHESGIVHRDLKPANVMVDAKGRARILDFGLAKIKGASKLTRAGSMVGTIAYASPEVTAGGDADTRSDIFSYGVVLYELISGERPFQADHEAALIYSILHDQPEPIARSQPGAPSALQEMLDKCLAKNPEERYTSFTALLADLMAMRAHMDSTSTNGEGKSGKPSIAVLPFTNMSADPENEYFSDGLSEELINTLTHLKELHVVSRTSSFAFKGKETDIREVGRKLNVESVLEGSVRKAGNMLRITAQLINVADGYHLWSERFDRELEDIFAIQDEISTAIADALKVTLVKSQEGSPVKRHTENIEAYNLNLRGRYFWSKRTEHGLLKGIEYFEQAIKEDPNFAPAYVGLADSFSLLCAYHIRSPKESLEQASAAGAQAMALDRNMAAAYEASAHGRMLNDWNWSQAENEFLRAIELNPGYATAHQRLGLMLSLLERMDEAKIEITRARELEPLSLIINTDVALLSHIAGDYDQAIEQCQCVLEMDPNFGVAHFVHGLALERQRKYDEAIASFHKAKNAAGGITVVTGAMGHAYAVSGATDEARMILEESEEIAQNRYVSPYSVATIHLGLKDHKKAMQFLAHACEEKSVWLIHLHLKVDPRLDELRSSPQFEQLLRSIGL